ncbi:MAG: GNAT family N-acetyltransferase [Brachybacterium sp.]|nr:GNAT family N-acetyltransferase [Brachybacterium sp.]
MSFEIIHDPRSERYFAVEDGVDVGVLTYERHRRRIDIVHTVTDPDERERGVASALSRQAFEDARAENLRVVVICPFVQSWLERHPEYTDLVVDG